MYRIFFICAAVLAAPLPALAQLQVVDAWVRASAPGHKTTGAFMTLRSSEAVRVVGVRSPVAGAAELHETRFEHGVAKMLPVAAIEIAAGGSVELKPGSYHVMLMELKHQVAAGEGVPITLVIEGKDGKRKAVDLTAAVRPLSTAASPPGEGHAHHGK